MHVLALLLVVLLIFFLAAWAELRRAGWPGPLSLAGEVRQNLGRFAGVFIEYPHIALPRVTAYALAVELLFVGSAFVAMPWGATDEPIRSSLANTLRQTWLRTTHLLPIVFLVGMFAAELNHATRQWYRAAPNRTAGSAQQRPWHLKHQDEMIATACFAAATWMVWAALRAVGARRGSAPVARPPTCEFCGYNLTGTSMDGRCPECGEPVAASLGPDVRTGTLWQQRRQVGRWRAWRRCCVDAVLRPRWFGRQLQVRSSRTDHRGFLVMHLPAAFVIGSVGGFGGIIAVFVVPKGFGLVTHDRWFALVGLTLLIGWLLAASALLIALIAAGLVGIWSGLRDARNRRNLMNGSMQAASYLSGFLVLWALFALLNAAAALALEVHGWFRAVEAHVHIDDDVLLLLSWLVPNLTCLAIYLVLVARITAGARYANK